MTINSMEEAAQAIQAEFARTAGNPAQQESLLNMAAQMGNTIWMSHTTPEEVKGVSDLFDSRELRVEFLGALNDVVTAPNNRESMIAGDLRDWVGEELRGVVMALGLKHKPA